MTQSIGTQKTGLVHPTPAQIKETILDEMNRSFVSGKHEYFEMIDAVKRGTSKACDDFEKGEI